MEKGYVNLNIFNKIFLIMGMGIAGMIIGVSSSYFLSLPFTLAVNAVIIFLYIVITLFVNRSITKPISMLNKRIKNSEEELDTALIKI